MPDRAKISSLEAIETFRARLVIFREKAGRVLDEVSEEVTRTRMWLQTDRVTFWEGQIRRRQKELEMRQQELFSAQISGMRDASFAQQQAVRRARQAIADAEAKLNIVKQWNRQYDQRVEPLGKQVEKLRHNLVHDLGNAIAFLTEVNKTIAAYAETSLTSPAAKPPAGEQTDATTNENKVST